MIEQINFTAVPCYPLSRRGRWHIVTFKNSAGLTEYAADSTYAFPDILSLACGVNQSDLIPKAIAFHPIIRRLLNDFGGTMVRVDALRLNPDAESQAHVTHRAIANIMNRFV